MAPSHSRQLLIWTLPTIAVFLSYLWYKRKRIGSKTDPSSSPRDSIGTIKFVEDVNIQESSKDCSNSTIPSDSINISGNSSSPESSSQSTPKKFSRSLSGVDSAPIDIIIPPKLKATKSNPVVISDEDLDLEIEKIRSMRYHPTTIDLKKSPEKSSSSNNNSNSSSNSGSGEKAKSISPPKESFTPTPTKVATSVIINSPMKKKMVQSVEEKLSPAKTSPLKASPKVEETKPTSNTSSSSNNNSGREERRNSERDSANHSPADVMLASPSLSSISDNHSEGSNDSGKGGSDVATPPPSRTPGTEESVVGGVILYEFTVPQTLVGKLIGKRGSFVTLIKDKTGAHVVVRKHPRNNKMKMCAVEGTQQEIDSALKLIRDKFPLKRFPEITLEQVPFYSDMPALQLTPDQLYLKLIEGINNDTIVSCMVAPNHLFLQQQNHPTFPNLIPLTTAMNECYMAVDSPLLPTPIPDNTICAAYSVNSWYRAIVLSSDNESGTCYVKFLDYGGYAYVEQSNLRQIRGDFMLMPFQAAESYLANIKPIGDEGWREEAYTAVAELTKGTIIYTQIADYAEDGIPLVHCYLLVGPRQIVFLNQELVNQGYAEWISNDGEAAGVSVA